MLRPACLIFALAFAAPAAGQEGGTGCGTTACDPLDGEALIEAWHHAALRDDEPAQADALRGLKALDFWTSPVVALARWTLDSVPPGAVLLAQGDGDALPMLGLQLTEVVRPDVTVVHVGLLDEGPYVGALASRAGLPLPASAADAARLIGLWTGEPGRPLVGALTLDPSVLGAHAPVVVSAGAYQIPGDEASEPFDLAAAEASADRVRGADFVGPRTSPGDRDPARLASPVDLGGVVLFQLLQTAVSHAQAGDGPAAERAYARARTFAAEARIADDPLVGVAREWIDDALARTSTEPVP